MTVYCILFYPAESDTLDSLIDDVLDAALALAGDAE